MTEKGFYTLFKLILRESAQCVSGEGVERRGWGEGRNGKRESQAGPALAVQSLTLGLKPQTVR